MPGDDAKQVEIGILFVHGIGKQAQGETLLSAASPLIAWLQKEPGNSLEIESVYLRPGRDLSDPPAHAFVRGEVNDHPVRILLAESWWAEEFYAPSPLKFAGWLLRFGAWILLRHINDQIFSRVEHAFRRFRIEPENFITGSLLPILVTPVIFTVFVVPFQLAVMVLAVLSQLKIFKAGEVASRGLRFLAEVVGDSYVYCSDPLSRKSVLTRIRDNLAWLQSRASHVTVMAHSQGAAATFDTLRLWPTACGLITYGSGIRKLLELELEHRKPTVGFLVTQVSWLYLVGCLWAASIIHQDFVEVLAGRTSGWQEAGVAYTYMAFGLLGGLVVSLLARWRAAAIDEELFAQAKNFASFDILWTDLTSSADPVPGGLLFQTHSYQADEANWIRWPGIANLRAAVVRNKLNILTDHTSYWQSHDDFLPRVAATISAQSGISLTRPNLEDSFRKASFLRALRGGVRWWLHTGLLVLSLVLFARAGQQCIGLLQGLSGSWLQRQLNSYQGITGVVVPVTITATALLLHIASVLLWIRFVSGPLWYAWDKRSRDTGRWAPWIRAAACTAFLVSVGAAGRLLWAAIEQRRYAAIPETVLRFVLRVHGALFL
jgi:hypothetical protein